MINPFQIFLLFVHLKFWLALYEWSKWPRWTNYAFFLTAFLVIQSVLALPWNLNQNVINLFSELCVGTDQINRQTLTQYNLWYQPLSGSTSLFLLKNNIQAPSIMNLKNNEFNIDFRMITFDLWCSIIQRNSNENCRYLYHDTSQPIPNWVEGYTYYFDKKTWIDVLLWLFMVVPMAIFVYWYWEPSRLRGYRLWLVGYLTHKICGAKNDEAVLAGHSIQSHRGSASRRGSVASRPDF